MPGIPGRLVILDKEPCMAEERFEPREINFRQWLPFTQLFRGFWVALDHKKLLLAAAGILIMACGWWVLAVAFINAYGDAPSFGSGNYQDHQWSEFEKARRQWRLLYEAAGPAPIQADANDLATSATEFSIMQEQFARLNRESQTKSLEELRQQANGEIERGELKGDAAKSAELWFHRPSLPHGKLRNWPWFENRGPNPFLLVSGKAGQSDAEGPAHYVPWQRGQFVDWFVQDQVPVLIEPLVKFLRPVFYLLHPDAGFTGRLYFLLVIAWTLATWALFGGAITRIAAVEVARNEKIGLTESLRYTLSRWRSYLFASFAPLVGIAVFVVLLMIFGLFNLIPIFADFWDGLLWGIVLGLGLVMAIVLIGLVGWPMIHATLGAEGSDSFDALSRCYSYVLQKPWSYLWYVIVALVYGAIVVFFVGFMGSLMVYLGKWGVAQTPFTQVAHRDPSYLFVYAPTSFGWRDLLLQGSEVSTEPGGPAAYIATHFRPWNYIGAGLVAAWLYIVFLMIVGFGYSYFWSASTIIYLLMRRKVDDTELDEVYLDEEDSEEPYSAPIPASSSSAPTGAAGTPPIQMVEPPSLRPTSAVVSAPSSASTTVETTAPSPGDGNVSGGGAGSS
jgi:hypothetical protein